jgi:hypothetical protein
MWGDFETFKIGLSGPVKQLIPDSGLERVVRGQVTVPGWIHPGKLHCLR